MSERQRVVFVGGGTGTLDAYAVLTRHCRRAVQHGRLELIVISAHDLRVAMPQAAVIPAVVTHVDRSRRVVTYVRVAAAGSGSVERLRYDELVLDVPCDTPALAPGLWTAGADLGLQLLRALSEAPASMVSSSRASSVAVARGGLEARRRALRRWTALMRNGFTPGSPPVPTTGLAAVPTVSTASVAPTAPTAPRRYAAVTTARRAGAPHMSTTGPSTTAAEAA